VTIRIIHSQDADFFEICHRIRHRGRNIDPSVLETVSLIVSEVERRGDEALFEYTATYDGNPIDADTVEVGAAECDAAVNTIDASLREVLSVAVERLERYHRRQRETSWMNDDEPDVEIGQMITPLERVGIYAPGGLAPYPSTVLMAAVPARIAGVQEVVLATPGRKGMIHPLILAAARMAGVGRVFQIGGAQAVAALAFGTASVPRVDKIVGPGNIYVATAKKIVFGSVGIDMIAGPSEIVVIADETANPDYVAADLLSQAEHDAMASAVLITPSPVLARQTARSVEDQCARLPRSSIAARSLTDYGAIIITNTLEEAADIASDIAPEHLELMVGEPKTLLGRVRNAGAVFLGHHTPEAVGDYLAGSNHILPTGGTARFASPLGVYDFVKRTSVVSFAEPALRRYGDMIAAFAAAEGLDAHGRSVTIRCKGPDR